MKNNLFSAFVPSNPELSKGILGAKEVGWGKLTHFRETEAERERREG